MNSEAPPLLTAALFIFSALALLYLIKGLLLLLVLPFFFAYIFNPPVNAMERHGLSRSLGTLLVFLSVSLLLTGAIVLLRNPAAEQVGALRSNIDMYGKKIETWVSRAEIRLQGSSEYKRHENRDASGNSSGFRTRWMNKAARILPGLFFGVFGSIVSLLTIVPLITFFLLRDGREIRRRIISLIPNRHFERTLILQHEISCQIGRYLRGECMRSLMVGTLIAAGLWIVDGPYPILMGVFAGLTNVIPFIGPYVGAAPALVITLFSGTGPGESMLISTGAVALVYVVIQLLDMMCINPVVLGKSVELHPLIIVLSLLAGVEFLGIIGMVLAVPFSSILKVIFVQMYRSKRRISC